MTIQNLQLHPLKWHVAQADLSQNSENGFFPSDNFLQDLTKKNFLQEYILKVGNIALG